MSRRAMAKAIVVVDEAHHHEVSTSLRSLVRPIAVNVVRAEGARHRVIDRARLAHPPVGIVVVVDAPDQVEATLAMGADEVIVAPFSAVALADALVASTARAVVRQDPLIDVRMLEQVVAAIANAIEAPITALGLDVDAVRYAWVRGGGGAEEGDPLGALEECAATVDQLTQIVRDLSLVTSGPGAHVSTPEPIDVGDLVDRVLRILGGAISSRVHVERVLPPSLPEALAPRRPLARAFAQILVHAIDAIGVHDSGSLRRVRIGARADRRSVAIVVDARPDVRPLRDWPLHAPVHLGRIAATRETLRAFGGELIVEHGNDGGVRYVVRLPRHGAEPMTAALRPSASRIARVSRPRILLVDADDRILRAAARAIASRFESVLATSAEEALALIEEGGIDAVVLDALLPDVCVPLLCEDIRQRDADLAGKVLLVTSTASGTGSRLPRGIAALLAKPLRRDALLSKLASVIEGPSVPPSRPLSEMN